METAAMIFLFFLLLRSWVLLTNLLTQQWLKHRIPSEYPMVSVLIPARNEEICIGALLEGLTRQDYPAFEVLVYDDDSTDQTAVIAEGYAKKYDHFRLIASHGDPPTGWLGKNRACHNLARRATGEYLLFLDADVTVNPVFLRDIMAHALKYRLHLCSLFPVQRMCTTGERLIVPLMNRILLSLLPLVLTRISRRIALSAANGQAMLFMANTYHRFQFHQAVKEYPVEDIRIFKMMKQLRLKSHTLLSGGQVSCRMYHGFQEALQGFSKNVFAFFGNSVILAILFATSTAFGLLPVLFSGNLILVSAWLILTTWILVVVALLSRQSILWNLLMAIPQQGAFILLIIRALRYRIFGGYQWKGRVIPDRLHFFTRSPGKKL